MGLFVIVWGDAAEFKLKEINKSGGLEEVVVVVVVLEMVLYIGGEQEQQSDREWNGVKDLIRDKGRGGEDTAIKGGIEHITGR